MHAMRRATCGRLHLLTDGLPKKSELPKILAAVRGGVDVFQLRPKGASDREALRCACWLDRELRGRVELMMNDRAVLAKELGWGLWIGQSDIPYGMARRLMGRALIGLSIETGEQAREAASWDVDFVGVGAYVSASKPEFRPLGLEEIGRLRGFMRAKIIGIGGIRTAGPVVEAGAHGVAVISAIWDARDPEEAARALRGDIDRGA